METTTIGARIQAARDRAVLSRAELAERSGLTYEALYLIETGKRSPRRRTIRAIAAALNIDPYSLVDISTNSD